MQRTLIGCLHLLFLDPSNKRKIESDYDDMILSEVELREYDEFPTPPGTFTDPPSIEDDIDKASIDNEISAKQDYCKKKQRKGNRQNNFMLSGHFPCFFFALLRAAAHAAVSSDCSSSCF